MTKRNFTIRRWTSTPTRSTTKQSQLYKQALEADPKYTDAIHGLTMCYQAKGDLDTAIELTRKYIEQEPEDILGWTNLSMLFQKKGNVPEAEKAGAEARRLDWKRQLKEGKK